MSLRTDLNANQPNRLSDGLADIKLGELLSYLINRLTPTQAGLVPASHVATMAAQPAALFQVNATTGTVTGVKKLLRGPISGEDAVVPATGEVVWDGGTNLLFATSDAVTAVSVTYALATDLASITMRNLGQTGNVQ